MREKLNILYHFLLDILSSFAIAAIVLLIHAVLFWLLTILTKPSDDFLKYLYRLEQFFIVVVGVIIMLDGIRYLIEYILLRRIRR